MARKIVIALTGNPNSGKTTIFNGLTGTQQHVGNYPGVTVEKTEGNLSHRDYNILLVDLPGTYSLTAHSLDELVTRNFLIDEKPDVVIDVVDASNLERNLYLAVQIMEMKIPLVLAFNMSDAAAEQGFSIDKTRLSELLGIPIIYTVATKREGILELIEKALNLLENKTNMKQSDIHYGEEIEKKIGKIESFLSQDDNLVRKYPLHWLATKILEGDSDVIARVRQSGKHAEKIILQAEKDRHHLKTIFGDTPDILIADKRYGFISGACSEAVRRTYEIRHTISDKADSIFLNKLLGLPIFLGMMWMVFRFTFTVSEPFAGWIEAAIAWCGNFAGRFLPQAYGIKSLVTEGIIGGVGSVLVFTPVILFLFLALAFLESSGYMARAAFIMDRFMHVIGLHGRSFVPMLLGFGCNLPAVMATRTIEDRRDRLITILIIPFMSCSARLPVYALFIGAFFPEKSSGNVLFSLYALGIAAAVFTAKIFRKYLFTGEEIPFVMELPPYRLPTVKGLLIHMREKGMIFIKKAGTIIFLSSVIVWFLSNLPWNTHYSIDYDTLISNARGNSEMIENYESQKASEKMENSYAGYMGKMIVPLLKPVGIDDWKAVVGLIGGIAAKEIIIGTLGTLYTSGNDNGKGEKSLRLREILQKQVRADGTKVYTPLSAYAFMVFVLLYFPCLATFAVIKKETNSWRWPAFTALYTTGVAWIVTFFVYQGGRLLGIE